MSQEIEEIAFKEAKLIYQNWSIFSRWNVLAIYKRTIEPSNTLVKAVESTAEVTHLI